MNDRSSYRILKNAVTPTKYKIQTNRHPKNPFNDSWDDYHKRVYEMGSGFTDKPVIRMSIEDAESAIDNLIYSIKADTWTVVI